MDGYALLERGDGARQGVRDPRRERELPRAGRSRGVATRRKLSCRRSRNTTTIISAGNPCFIKYISSHKQIIAVNLEANLVQLRGTLIPLRFCEAHQVVAALVREQLRGERRAAEGDRVVAEHAHLPRVCFCIAAQGPKSTNACQRTIHRHFRGHIDA